jgi:DNA-3-methyladenine glycosylase
MGSFDRRIVGSKKIKASLVPLAFFNRPATIVAKELLGKFLVREYDGASDRNAYMITEVEVYDGPRDKGSHAWRGQTPRNTPMFGPAGHWYVYFTYGIHWMLNIVTGEVGYPSAILIRGVEGINGPARLTKALSISKAQNDKPAIRKTGLWVEDRGIEIPAKKIKKGPRIGINYAGAYWASRHLRFWIDP